MSDGSATPSTISTPAVGQVAAGAGGGPPGDSRASVGTQFLFMKPMPSRGRDFSSIDLTPSAPADGSPRAMWQDLTRRTESVVDPIGVPLGHFAIEKLIGRGGMGAVFAAMDTRLDRRVALKVLSPEHSGTTAAVERFRNEARAAARLDHDNIARVFYVGEDRGLHFIAFEFIEGTNLRELIRRHGRISPPDAIRLGLQIAAALRHTDAQGVVHRDVKPSNIILMPSGRAKLVDLGLARKHDPEATHDITVAGTTLGTFDYISPEQARDPREVDVRSDLYSLGCTLYHALTGMPPYPEGSMMQKLLDHQDAAIPRVAESNPQVSEGLSELVYRLMQPAPADRPQSPDEVIGELSAEAVRYGLVAGGSAGDGLVWTRPRGDRRPLWRRHLGWLASAVALLLIAGFVSVPVESTPDRPASRPSGEVAAGERSGRDRQSDNADLFGLVDSDREDPSLTAIDAAGSDRSAADGSAKRAAAETVPVPSVPMTAVLPTPDGMGGRSRQPFPLPGSDQQAATAPQRAAAESGPSATAASVTGERSAVDEPSTREAASPSSSLSSVASRPSGAGRSSVDAAAAPSNAAPADREAAAREAALAVDLPFRLTSTRAIQSQQRFATLQQAVSAAGDRDVIDIMATGRIRGLHRARLFGKHLTLRSTARGPRPQLRLAAESSASIDAGLVTLADGSELEIFNVDLLIEPARGPMPHAAFALSGSSMLRLSNTTVTFLPPRQPRVDDALPALVLAEHDPVMRGTETGAGVFETQTCLIRGAADLVRWDGQDLLEVDLTQTGIAIDGVLLHAGRTVSMAVDPRPSAMQVTLDHITAMVPGPLIRVEADDLGTAATLEVEAQDSVLAALRPLSPLIETRGLSRSALRSRVQWMGGRNRFDWPSQLAWRSGEATLPLDRWLADAPLLRDDTSVTRSVAGVIGPADRPTAEFGPDEFAAPTDSPIKRSALDASDAGVAVDELRSLLGPNPQS